MLHIRMLLVSLLLGGSLLSAGLLAYALKTNSGRQQIICSAVASIAGPPPQDPTTRANLALRGQPFNVKAPAKRADWHYVALGPLAIPLPPGNWQRLEPESSGILFQAESSELRVRVETYPYRYANAAATLSPPSWMVWLLGDRLTRIKQPIIAAFRRDLSNGCDPQKDFRTLLLDAFLTELKTVVSHSGRAIAARWGRSPTRFALAYETTGTTIIRYTQKLGDNAFVIEYETASSTLARTMLEQIELVPSARSATITPEKLAKIRPRIVTSSLDGSNHLKTPAELCQMMIDDWATTTTDELKAFVIKFPYGSSSLTPEAEVQLKRIAQAANRRPSQITVMAIPGPEYPTSEANLLMKVQLGMIRYWLWRNANLIVDEATEITTDTSSMVGPAVIIELAPAAPKLSPTVSETLAKEFTQALYLPVRDRTSYIRSRRRGDETPMIGLLRTTQTGSTAVDTSGLADRLGQEFDQSKLFLHDLSQLPGLADKISANGQLPQDLAETLRDCLSIDFLLVSTLSTIRTGDDSSTVLRFEFAVQLIELSTLDLVGSWTTVHAASSPRPGRFLLATEALPFAPGSDELTPKARLHLENLLRSVRSRPGATIKVRGLARRDETEAPDQDHACLALASARQVAVEKHLHYGGVAIAASREHGDAPSCGNIPLYQHAIFEIWSEREATFWSLGLID